MRTYNSFLIRCWLTREPPQDGRAVYVVEHIQTGERTRVASLRDVRDWIDAACRGAPRGPAGESGPPRRGGGFGRGGPGETAESRAESAGGVKP